MCGTEPSAEPQLPSSVKGIFDTVGSFFGQLISQVKSNPHIRCLKGPTTLYAHIIRKTTDGCTVPKPLLMAHINVEIALHCIDTHMGLQYLYHGCLSWAPEASLVILICIWILLEWDNLCLQQLLSLIFCPVNREWVFCKYACIGFS